MRTSDLLALATSAEEFGFHSLWLGEHLVLPVGYESPHPTDTQAHQSHPVRKVVEEDTPLVDPLVCFAAIAALTQRLELGTAIYLLGLRHPLLTARSVSTLQEISANRFVLGVGTGWLREEFDALGVPFDERVKRYDDALVVARKAWSGEAFEHTSPWFPTNGRIKANPERCSVPVVFGGNTERAFERAAKSADGWFASGMPDLDDFLRMRDRIEQLRGKFGRTGKFRYWVRAHSWEPGFLEPYERAGVEEVLIWAKTPYPATEFSEVWPDGSISEGRARIAEVARVLGLGPAIRDA